MEAISNDDILVTQVVTPIKPDLLFCMSHLHVIFIYSLFVARLFVWLFYRNTSEGGSTACVLCSTVPP